MKGRRWNDAVEVLRAAKIYACHSYDFYFSFRTESRGQLLEELDAGSGILDPVHNSVPSLVDSTSLMTMVFRPCLLTTIPTQIAPYAA